MNEKTPELDMNKFIYMNASFNFQHCLLFAWKNCNATSYNSFWLIIDNRISFPPFKLLRNAGTRSFIHSITPRGKRKKGRKLFIDFLWTTKKADSNLMVSLTLQNQNRFLSQILEERHLRTQPTIDSFCLHKKSLCELVMIITEDYLWSAMNYERNITCTMSGAFVVWMKTKAKFNLCEESNL